MHSLVRLLLLPVLLPAAALAQDSPERSPARVLGNAFAAVYEKVAPSVVVLEVERQEDLSGDALVWDLLFQGREPQMEPRLEESEGSGFVIRKDGYILTNAHVVQGADREKGVVARRQDGTRMPLTIVGIDEKTDLAVLKADAENLPAVEWGDSESLRVGEFVCGIGAPFELDYTLTVGVLSAKGRNIMETAYEDYLQTDAAINPGNSGGPLCDLDGRVIGVNTLINGFNRGLSFAISDKLARAVSDELIAEGRVVRPWLGVRITTLGNEPGLQQVMGLDKGVLIKTIEPDAPASRSELRPADVIVAIDGRGVETARDLQREVLGKRVGEKVDLKVWRRNVRDGSYLQVAVVTDELPDTPLAARRREAKRPREDAGSDESTREPGDPGWGLELEAVEGATGGVRIVEVEPGSPAAVAGIEPDDIVTAVGSETVKDPVSFGVALAKLQGDEAAVLMIERKGKKTYAILKR